jgi:hypothetical protein
MEMHIKSFTKQLACLLFFLTPTGNQVFSQSWDVMGNSDFDLPSASTAENVSIKISLNDNAFISFTEPLNNNNAVVKQLVDGRWIALGDGPNPEVASSHLSIAVTSNNKVFAAFSNSANNGKATVMYWDGATWITVGQPGLSDAGADYTRITVDSNDIPHLIYSDLSASGKATVKKWDGSNWLDLGTPAFSEGAISYPRILFDSDANLFVCYTDEGLTGKVAAKKLSENSWINVGNGAVSDGAGIYPSMDLKSGGVYIAYSDATSSNKVTAKRLVDGNWEAIGQKGFSSRPVTYNDIKVDDNGTIMVAYKDNGPDPYLMSFDGANWLSNRIPRKLTSIGNLDLDIYHGNPIIILPSTINSQRAFVATWQNNNWDFVGPIGFGGVNTNIYSDPSGNVYGGALKRFTGSSWTNVGRDGLPGFFVPDPISVFDSEGNLYMSYNESTFSRGKVAKWNGEEWTILGNNYYSDGNVYNGSLGITADDEIYISFCDSNSGRANVKRWTGEQWVHVGEQNFTPNGANELSLKFDSDGSLYFAFVDLTVKRLFVYKFEDGEFTQLGEENDIFDFDTYKFTLDFGPDNYPNVVTTDVGGSRSINIRKWNGETWEVLSGEGLAQGNVDAETVDMLFDNSGRMVISFADAGISSKAIVKVFEDESWHYVGDGPISYGSVRSTSLALDNFGGLYCMFFTLNLYNYAYRYQLTADPRLEQTIIFDEIPKRKYGDPPFLISGSGGPSGKPVQFSINNESVATISGNTVSIKGVGLAKITAYQEGTVEYLPATTVHRDLIVEKALLTVTAQDRSRYYGQENPAFAPNYSGFVYNDGHNNIKEPTGATVADKGSSVGEYAITFSGGESDDYDFEYVDGKLTILKASLRVTAENKSMIYGDSVPLLTASYFGFQNEDTMDQIVQPTINTEGNSKSDAGDYTIVLFGGEAENYEFSFVNGKLTIDKSTLRVAANDTSRLYKRQNPPIRLSYDGFKNDDTASDINFEPGITIYADLLSPVGDYRTVPSGGSAHNYFFEYVEGVITIVADTAQIAISDTVQVFDSTPKMPIITTSPEGISLMVLYDGLTQAPTAAGSYEILATITDPNYFGSAHSIFIIRDITGTSYSLHDQNSIKTYPNPVTDRLFIDVGNAKANMEGTMKVIDSDGKILISQRTTLHSSLQIDLSSLKEGIYFLIITNESQSILSTHKIIRK